MRTPFGIECPYFYGDYYRGKKQEECRLIGNKPSPNNWTADLCKTCPVPAITRANSCSHMTLYPTIKRTKLGTKRQVKVTAFCSESKSEVAVPEIGCGICHPEFEVFKEQPK
jgi:hypothetical protein